MGAIREAMVTVASTTRMAVTPEVMGMAATTTKTAATLEAMDMAGITTTTDGMLAVTATADSMSTRISGATNGKNIHYSFALLGMSCA